MPELKFDEIGYWSEIKLQILREYAAPYNRVLKGRFETAYIDGFAGAGRHISKTSGGVVQGSPVIAMQVDPPFERIYLVDLDESRTEELRRISAGDHRVEVFTGDCNEVLLRDVFPKVRFEEYRRALCILDPY